MPEIFFFFWWFLKQIHERVHLMEDGSAFAGENTATMATHLWRPPLDEIWGWIKTCIDPL